MRFFLCAVKFNFADVHLYHRFLVTADNGHVDDHDEGIDVEVMCDASVTAVHVYKPTPNSPEMRLAFNISLAINRYDLV